MSNDDGKKRDGVQAVVDLLTAADPAFRDQMLKNIGEKDPQLVQQLKERLVVFTDLTRLDDASMRSLFLECPREWWELSFRKAPTEVFDFVLKLLPARTQQDLKESIALAAPRKISDVQQAQSQITKKMQDGIQSGRLHYRA